MLEVEFSIKCRPLRGKDGDVLVEHIYRSCNVKRPTCKGCKWEKFCKKMMSTLVKAAKPHMKKQ